MNIVVLNRMHLDEWPADRVAKILESYFTDHPMVKWFSREAPPAGMWQRGYDTNIVYCLPDPNGNREERDAYAIGELCRDADLVFDIHGSKVPGSFPFYRAGTTNPLVMGVLSLLENDFVVACDPEHVANRLPNYAGWDLEPGATILERLVEYLERLASGWIPPTRPMKVYRLAGAIEEADAVRLGLPEELPRCTRLDDGVARELGLPVPLFTLCWSSERYRHVGGRGEVMTI